LQIFADAGEAFGTAGECDGLVPVGRVGEDTGNAGPLTRIVSIGFERAHSIFIKLIESE
jgi:hypothetical protein